MDRQGDEAMIEDIGGAPLGDDQMPMGLTEANTQGEGERGNGTTTIDQDPDLRVQSNVDGGVWGCTGEAGGNRLATREDEESEASGGQRGQEQ
jgi:hypothetical protein